MGSSSGNSSGSPQIQTSENLRKRKRMESNRESARRSRMRKQKRLDDLTAEIAQLSGENNEISSSINVTTAQYVKVEAENSVLRAQMMELTQRLQSLNEIISYINSAACPAAATAGGSCVFEAEEFQNQGLVGDGFGNVNCGSLMGVNQQPIMASAQMFDYY